jgi:hypothetical protein
MRFVTVLVKSVLSLGASRAGEGGGRSGEWTVSGGSEKRRSEVWKGNSGEKWSSVKTVVEALMLASAEAGQREARGGRRLQAQQT